MNDVLPVPSSPMTRILYRCSRFSGDVDIIRRCTCHMQPNKRGANAANKWNGDERKTGYKWMRAADLLPIVPCIDARQSNWLACRRRAENVPITTEQCKWANNSGQRAPHGGQHRLNPRHLQANVKLVQRPRRSDTRIWRAWSRPTKSPRNSILIYEL